MFAIIKTGGKQYRVQEGDVLAVEKLPAGASQKFHFSQVLLIDDEKETWIGTPFIEKALVRAEVLENFKNDKIIVFKKKRRKQFRRTRGHRQELTRVRIEKVIPDVTILPAEALKEAEKKPVAPPVPEKVEKEVKAREAVEKAAAAEKKPAKKAAKPEKAKKAAKPKKEAPAKVSKKKPAK